MQAVTELASRSGLDGGGPVSTPDRVDAALLWIRTIFRYYEQRLGQRGSEEGAFALRAADEIVWACTLRGATHPPPLVFYESTALPWAVESSRPLPPHLAPSATAATLARVIQSIPVPLLAVPPWLSRSPGTFVALAHEAGHHVYAGLGIHDAFRTLCAGAAAEVDPRLGERWRGWASEVFADIWSVTAMGGWALHALAEELWTQPQQRAASSSYPPSATRLRTMASFGKRVGFGTPDIASLLPAGVTVDDADARVADALADAALAHVVINEALREMVPTTPGFAAAFDRRVMEVADALANGAGVGTWEPHLQVPRVLACAAAQMEIEGRTMEQVWGLWKKPFEEIIAAGGPRAATVVVSTRLLGIIDSVIAGSPSP
jgi:hypothetical protein